MIATAAALLAVPALASASTGASVTSASHATSQVTAASHQVKHRSRLKVHAAPRKAVNGARIRLSAQVYTWRPPPTGKVTFWTGHRKLCSAPVHHDWARCTTEFRNAGRHVVKGVYSGDSRHYGSVGRVTVRTTRPPAKHRSRLKVHAAPRKAIAGTPIRLSAQVYTWRPPPTGKVTFWTGHQKLCSAPVHHDWARCTTEFRSGGTRVVKGVYSGDSRHHGSAGHVTVRTTRPHTTTTVTASTYQPNLGQTVTLTATVHSPGRLTPTGKMRFTVGQQTLCVSALQDGAAQCSYAWTSSGQFRVTGSYSGDTAHISSRGESGVITVSAIATTTVIMSVKPDTVPAGKSATVTVTVSNKVTGAPPATGKVLVAPASATIAKVAGYFCTVTLTATSNGTGTCTITPPVPSYGLIHYDATYSGDSTHTGSKYTGGYLVIVPDVTTTTVTFNPTAGTAGKADTITATVLNQAKDNISPSAGGTGTVTFSIGGTPISAACTNVKLSYTKAAGNTAACSYTPTAAGKVTVTAAYSGDPTNLPSSGSGTLTTP